MSKPAMLPGEVSECALAANVRDGVCMGDTSIKILKKIIGKEGTAEISTVVEDAKTKLNCNSQRCILERLGDAGKRDITHNLKVPGPTDVSLLNNFNIDDTMKQWTLKFKDFFPYDFNMRDYEDKNKTLHTIKMEDLYDGNLQIASIRSRVLLDNGEETQPFRTAACVINTDYYSGKGEHWMAFFVDMRSANGPWTVEFFNSSGNAPLTEYADWMEKTKIELEQIIAKRSLPVSEVVCKRVCLRHQRSRTECGVYSLFYIYCRLMGMPVEHFQRNRIPDETMFEFRQHLFYDKNREQMQVFNYAKFAGSTNILWE